MARVRYVHRAEWLEVKDLSAGWHDLNDGARVATGCVLVHIGPSTELAVACCSGQETTGGQGDGKPGDYGVRKPCGCLGCGS